MVKGLSIALLAFFLSIGCLACEAQPHPCDPVINGFHLRNVYITGSQYNAVRWAYKHLSDATCLTPVTNVQEADVILELLPAEVEADTSADVAFSVSCFSGVSGSTCVDSAGNQMSTACSTGGDCVSYFGPSAASVAGTALHAWLSTTWSAASATLYTREWKPLWVADAQKGAHWYDQWDDRLREATFHESGCKVKAAESGARFRKYAERKCNISLPARASIDMQANDRLAELQQRHDQSAAMRQNAADAERQRTQAPPE